MPITPGITQASGLLNSLFRQGSKAGQQIQSLQDPEAVASPADTILLQERTPVLKQLSGGPFSGWDADSVQQKTVTGNILTINDALPYPLLGLTVGFEPVQAGSGDPSPTNVRPITGWTGLSVYRTGKNIFDGYLYQSNINADGTEIPSTNRLGSAFCPITTGRYTISFNSQFQCAIYVFSEKAPGTQISEESHIYWNTSPLTFDIVNGKYYRIKFKKTNGEDIVPEDLTDVQIELGSSNTVFTAYQGTPYPVTFPTPPGIVYGGSVDLITGVLTVTHGQIASYNGETLPGEWISDRDVYASGTTPTTGAQVVYELAEPQTYQLDPVRITLLQNQTNNILSDANGTLTATYAAM